MTKTTESQIPDKGIMGVLILSLTYQIFVRVCMCSIMVCVSVCICVHEHTQQSGLSLALCSRITPVELRRAIWGSRY